MKKLSEVYKELGIAFTFPIEIENEAGKETYREDSDGYSCRREYNPSGKATYCENSRGEWWRRECDSEGLETYFENSHGFKKGTPRPAKTCEGKVIKIDGVKYELKTINQY